jgi:hypothetical protein
VRRRVKQVLGRVVGRLAPASELNELVENPARLGDAAFAAFTRALPYLTPELAAEAWAAMSEAERGVYEDHVLEAARKRAAV